MNERLLQFIWQFQYFNVKELFTTQGERVVIERCGMLNLHQGPDFSEAWIHIGNTTWVGAVELHLLASDWNRHRHYDDPYYQKIILHVVWEEDELLFDGYGNRIPTLELKDRIAASLLQRYRCIMDNPMPVSCASFLPALTPLAWYAWKERLAAERLEQKAMQVLETLQQCNGDWEEVCWRSIAGNFGGKVNRILFEQVATALPVRLLARHRNRRTQLEALLMGQANLLGHAGRDAYGLLLQREYAFYRNKYKLVPSALPAAFLRMRPASFPTIRLSQLAALFHRCPSFYSLFCEARSVASLSTVFADIAADDYWNTHYHFKEESKSQPKYLGRYMADNLIINTVIPLLFAHATYHNAAHQKAHLLSWLLELPAEQNRITREWQTMGITIHSALDSQAMTELSNHYCAKKRCLVCAVGNKILNAG